jgi:hypothetical protein
MWRVIFYASAAGRQPVRKVIEEDLSADQRARLRERLRTLQQHGPWMAEEYPKALQRLTGPRYRDLYEVRIANDQLRVFLFFHQDTAVLVHAITKAGKGRKKMRAQYDTALARRNDGLERRAGR